MSPTKNNTEGFSAEEKAAMKQRAKELKAEERLGKDRADGLQALLTAIGEMAEPDRSTAQGVHEIVTASAPNLIPKTWYGMPAYANSEGKVVCFFQNAGKFNARYSTFGFNDSAYLDDGAMWPTSYAIKELTPAAKAELAKLVKRAVS